MIPANFGSDGGMDRDLGAGPYHMPELSRGYTDARPAVRLGLNKAYRFAIGIGLI